MARQSERRFSGLAKLAVGVCIVLLTAGCATVRHGGAPEPAFSYEQDLKDLEAAFKPAASIAKITGSPNDVNVRNQFIDGRLALYNIRYVRFVRDLGVDKQHLDAATDILVLGLGLAGAATGGLRSKSNLALATAGVTGTKIAIDKHFYFDKTVQALVSTMNAQRKQVLVKILEGRRTQTMDGYPMTRVFEDLAEYEMAGTLIGAINVLQADAAEKEKAADIKVRRAMEIPTQVQLDEKGQLRKALSTLATDNKANLDKINAILKTMGLKPHDKFDDASNALAIAFTDDILANLPKWRAAIEAEKVAIPK